MNCTLYLLSLRKTYMHDSVGSIGAFDPKYISLVWSTTDIVHVRWIGVPSKNILAVRLVTPFLLTVRSTFSTRLPPYSDRRQLINLQMLSTTRTTLAEYISNHDLKYYFRRSCWLQILSDGGSWRNRIAVKQKCCANPCACVTSTYNRMMHFYTAIAGIQDDRVCSFTLTKYDHNQAIIPWFNEIHIFYDLLTNEEQTCIHHLLQ